MKQSLDPAYVSKPLLRGWFPYVNDVIVIGIFYWSLAYGSAQDIISREFVPYSLIVVFLALAVFFVIWFMVLTYDQSIHERVRTWARFTFIRRAQQRQPVDQPQPVKTSTRIKDRLLQGVYRIVLSSVLFFFAGFQFIFFVMVFLTGALGDETQFIPTAMVYLIVGIIMISVVVYGGLSGYAYYLDENKAVPTQLNAAGRLPISFQSVWWPIGFGVAASFCMQTFSTWLYTSYLRKYELKLGQPPVWHVSRRTAAAIMGTCVSTVVLVLLQYEVTIARLFADVGVNLFRLAGIFVFVYVPLKVYLLVVSHSDSSQPQSQSKWRWWFELLWASGFFIAQMILVNRFLV